MENELLYQKTLSMLERRKVDLQHLSKIVCDLQKPYLDLLTEENCLHHIMRVLEKREVQHAVITGISLDELAEKKMLPTPLQEIVETDEGLYGVDEILALSITNVYGSIGLTNFGYLDKVKPGLIGEYNIKKRGEVHTFLDDILCAIAAAACSRIAHKNKLKTGEGPVFN